MKKQRKDNTVIFTLTMNPGVDISMNVESVTPEKKLRGLEPRFEPGGGGINVARAVRTFDGKAHALTMCGGTVGQRLRQLIEKAGLDCTVFDIANENRQSLAVYEESSGQQYRFGMPGPSVSNSEWQTVLSHIQSIDPPPSLFVASGSLPPGVPDSFYAKLAQILKDRGCRMILDTSGRPLRKAVDKGVYMIKPNMAEISTLVGVKANSEEKLSSAIHKLVTDGKCEVVVLSLGAGGVLFAAKDGVERLHSPTVPVKSKVGAGDSMVGGLAYALANESGLRDSVLFGIAAGSAATMTPGTELCRKKDVEELFGKLRSDG